MDLTQAKAHLAQQTVHPFATDFPLLPDDELQELADDIAANGLLIPIMRDAAEQLIDGRNRLIGCTLAGVAPHYATLPPDRDPVEYIYSLNATRRMLNAGQRAMCAVRRDSLLFRKRLTVNRYTADGTPSQRKLAANEAGTSQSYISMAWTVSEHAPELVAQVLHGGSLYEAYFKHAKPRKEAQQLREAACQKLRHRHPVLWEQLQTGTLTEGQALAMAEAQEQEELRERTLVERREQVRTLHLALEPLPEEPITLPAVGVDPDRFDAADLDRLGQVRDQHDTELARLDTELAFLRRIVAVTNGAKAVVAAGLPEDTAGWWTGAGPALLRFAATLTQVAREAVALAERDAPPAKVRAVK